MCASGKASEDASSNSAGGYAPHDSHEVVPGASVTIGEHVGNEEVEVDHTCRLIQRLLRSVGSDHKGAAWDTEIHADC